MFEGVDIRPSLPQIGYKAPDFTARTTFGDIKLSDFKGKWVVLFSHPADFSAVRYVLNIVNSLYKNLSISYSFT